MKLSGEHFRRVVRRIESIVPIAGDGIKVEPVDGGHKIINDSPSGFGECGFVAQGYAALFKSCNQKEAHRVGRIFFVRYRQKQGDKRF